MSAPLPPPDVIATRAARLARAADPAPSSIERGPTARLHWRHGVASDPALASVVDPVGAPPMSGEWASVLAETHARLVTPGAVAPLARPAPVGLAVGEALAAHPSWQALTDAAALHPGIARDAVVGLADVVRGALTSAGAADTDTRRLAADLEAARARLEALRALAPRQADGSPDTSTETARDAHRLANEAGAVEERAAGAVQAGDAMGARVRAALGTDATEAAMARIVGHAEEKADAVRAAVIAGLGSALGSHDVAALPDAVVALLTPEVAALLRRVGALRLALREGRASRHLPGREGMLGPDVGGLDRAGDLTALARAGLAGLLGPGLAAVERLRLVQGRAAVVEKGGGKANKGDVAIVVDKSGSMRGARETWAMALALALLLEARAEHRAVAVVTYSGHVLASVIVDGPAAMPAALAAILRTSGGSNNERAALVEAGAVLGRMRRGGDPADVVMITDGQWEASNMTGSPIGKARLRGVFIGGSVPPGAAFASAWEVRAVDDGNETGADAIAVEIASVVV